VNRKRALPPDGSGNPVVVLNTVPVGASPTSTTSGTIAPAPLYSVERPVPLSATHQGDVELAVNPQALTRFASLIVPPTPVSDTSGWTVKLPAPAAPAAVAETSTSAIAATTMADRARTERI